MIKIRVPATSANVGCGFDCLGLALDLYSIFTFEEIEEGLEWINVDTCFANEDNLIYTSFMKTLSHLNKTVKGIRIGIEECNIPVSRGLGSSSSCVVAGIMGAYAVTNTPIDKKDILNIATKIEGHPDNVAPCIYGGLRAGCIVNGETISVPYAIDSRFVFQALIPDFETLTNEARKVIPFMISHKDAIYTYSRLSVILKAFETYDLDIIHTCMGDKMHEPYRRKLIYEYDIVKKICEDNKSICLLISGSGSTLLNIIEKEEDAKCIEEKLKVLKHRWKSIVLHIDQEGAVIC